MFDDKTLQMLKVIGLNPGIVNEHNFVLMQDDTLSVFDGNMYLTVPFETPVECAIHASKFLRLIEKTESISPGKNRLYLKGKSFNSYLPTFPIEIMPTFDNEEGYEIACGGNFIDTLRMISPFTETDLTLGIGYTTLHGLYCYSNSNVCLIKIMVDSKCDFQKPLYLTLSTVKRLVQFGIEPDQILYLEKGHALWLVYSDNVYLRVPVVNINQSLLPEGKRNMNMAHRTFRRNFAKEIKNSTDRTYLSKVFFDRLQEAEEIRQTEQPEVNSIPCIYLVGNAILSNIALAQNKSTFKVPDMKLKNAYSFNAKYFLNLAELFSTDEKLTCTFFRKLSHDAESYVSYAYVKHPHKDISGFIAGFTMLTQTADKLER